ncbi:MAG: hypothetical protein NZ700_16755 [Gemmataceae bacterium]|nr:hypothetical protein [Gemmataceae bacterium]
MKAYLQTCPSVGWLPDAMSLAEALDHAQDEEQFRECDTAAVMLFNQLDDTQLAVWQARQLASKVPTEARSMRRYVLPKNMTEFFSESEAGVRRGLVSLGLPLGHWNVGPIPASARLETRAPELGWEESIAKQAEDFLESHPEVFLPAADWAAAWQSVFRSDLDETDFELWETTLKHRRLEELVEDLEAGPTLERPKLPDAVARKLLIVTVPTSKRDVRAHHWRKVQPPGLAAAAAAPPAAPLTTLRWYSPDGNTEARLLLPTEGEWPARLALYERSSGEAASAYGGRTIRLAGIERTLNDRAQADFVMRELHDARQHLLLEVTGEPWDAVPD